MIKEIKTKEEFVEFISKNKKVFVDYHAEWCGPCIMMGPVLEKVVEENSDIVVAKVNVDELPELAQEQSVMSIPTLALVENGIFTKRDVGFMTKEKIIDFYRN